VVIVDTSVFIDYLRGVTNPETEWLDLHADQQRLGLTTLILTEILQGVDDERRAASLYKELREFEIFEMPDVELAVDAARHYRRLRQIGHTPRKTIDVLIASFCIRRHHELLHRDRDFDPLELHLGLRVVHP
jgi:predicted nucleic acid-binding protein